MPISASPTLHMICGKIGAGKSTLAAKLGAEAGTVVVAEDDWLRALFADQMRTGADFLTYSGKVRAAMGPHVVALLRAGVSVVLDFQANTVESRTWMRGLFEQAGVDHRLHVLATPDEVCLARLKARNAKGDHPFAPTEEQFHRFSRYFVAPTPEEGFTIVMHGEGA